MVGSSLKFSFLYITFLCIIFQAYNVLDNFQHIFVDDHKSLESFLEKLLQILALFFLNFMKL